LLLIPILMALGCISVQNPQTYTPEEKNITISKGECKDIFGLVDANSVQCAPCVCNLPNCTKTTKEECEDRFQLIDAGAANASLTYEIEKCESMELSNEEDCYAALALKYEIPTLCDNAYSIKEDCIFAVAVKYNKPGYCDLVGNMPYGITTNSCRAAFE